MEPSGKLLLFRRVRLAQLGTARSVGVVLDVRVLHGAEPFFYLKPLDREASAHFFHSVGGLRERGAQGVDAALSGVRLGALGRDPREDRTTFLFERATVHLPRAPARFVQRND